MKTLRMEIRRKLLITGALKLSDSLMIAKLRVETTTIFFSVEFDLVSLSVV